MYILLFFFFSLPDHRGLFEEEGKAAETIGGDEQGAQQPVALGVEQHGDRDGDGHDEDDDLEGEEGKGRVEWI